MSAQEIEDLRRQLLASRKVTSAVEKPLPKKSLKKADCTLQEWTDHQRALERGYDAKRRAKKRQEGPEFTSEERRSRRESAVTRSTPLSSAAALDTVIAAAQALDRASMNRDQPATGILAELEQHLKSRLGRLKMTLD